MTGKLHRNPMAIVASCTSVAVLIIGILAACSGRDNYRDVENVPSRNPQKIEVYNNVNDNPNITRLCIDGIAFATTTRTYAPILRVPEWDRWCSESLRSK